MAVNLDASRALRDAFGAFPTGVAIVTTLDGNGAPVGVTVNSFASLSLQPPLVNWSLNARSPSRPAFERARVFAVNVLAHEQVELSRRFGTSVPDKFKGVAMRAGLEGVPVLEGVTASFECRVVACHPGGDHILFIGAVERFAHDAARPPLVFHAGACRAVGDFLG